MGSVDLLCYSWDHRPTHTRMEPHLSMEVQESRTQPAGAARRHVMRLPVRYASYSGGPDPWRTQPVGAARRHAMRLPVRYASYSGGPDPWRTQLVGTGRHAMRLPVRHTSYSGGPDPAFHSWDHSPKTFCTRVQTQKTYECQCVILPTER